MKNLFSVHWFDPGTNTAGCRIVEGRWAAWKQAWRYVKTSIIVVRLERWA